MALLSAVASTGYITRSGLSPESMKQIYDFQLHFSISKNINF